MRMCARVRAPWGVVGAELGRGERRRRSPRAGHTRRPERGGARGETGRETFNPFINIESTHLDTATQGLRLVSALWRYLTFLWYGVSHICI